MDTTVVQKSLVLNSEGQILLVRRSATDTRRPLQWDLPGGMLEPGEGLLDGVEREILEETGLKVAGTHVVYSKTEYRTWNDGAEEANVVFMFYSSHAKSTTVIVSEEHDLYEWKTISQALTMFEYPLHIEFMKHVIQHKVAL